MRFSEINRRGSPGFRDGWQTHHLIPRQCLSDHRLACLLDAGRAGGFDADDFDHNGILLPANERDAKRSRLPLHSGPHPAYNKAIEWRLAQIAGSVGPWLMPGAGDVAAAHVLNCVAASLRDAIRANCATDVVSLDCVILPGKHHEFGAILKRLENKQSG